MACKKCDGLGVFFIKIEGKLVGNKCEPCIFQYRKLPAISTRKIYEEATTFMEHEDQLQWDMDHPNGLVDDYDAIRNTNNNE